MVGLATLWAMGSLVLGIGRSRIGDGLGRAALAHLIGVVLMVAATLAWSLLSGRLAVWPTYGLAVALAVWHSRMRGRPDAWRSGPDDVGRSPVAAVVGWAAIGVGAGAVVVTLAGTGLAWDAWAIWQLKARVFFHDGAIALLRDATYDYAHRDYPLLVPVHTWWLYVHAGVDDDRLAQWAGAVFAADLVAVLWLAARTWVGRNAALLAAGIVAAQPCVVRHAASGYADVPLAAYLIATAAILACAERERNPQVMAVAAVMAAGCAGAKNEGVVATLLVACALSVWAVSRAGAQRRDPSGGPSSRLWHGAAPLVALALCAGPWWVTAARLGVRNDIVDRGRYRVVDTLYGAASAGPGRSAVRVPADSPAQRAGMIARAAASSARSVGPEYPGWGLAWPLALVGLAVGLRRRLRGAWVLPAFAMVQAAAYGWAYLRTPHPLAWHLATSLDRLMLHLLPLLTVFACVALVRRPPSEAGGMGDQVAGQTEPRTQVVG
jgi:hypothetical protein